MSKPLNRIAALGAQVCWLLVLGCSDGQSEATRALAQADTLAGVFINEIHYDNVGTDEGEAIEVAGPAGTDLSSYELVLYNGADTVRAPYGTVALSGTLADAGGGVGFYVVNFPANGLQNGAPDGVALVHGGTVVQFLSYEGSFVAASGPAAGMTSQDIGKAEGAATPVGYSLQLTGAGSSTADFTWSDEGPSTFGSSNTGQTFGSPEVVAFINELHYDNVGTDEGEAIEVAATAGADLSGYQLVLYNGAATSLAPYDTITLSGVVADQGGGFGFVVANLPSNGLQNGSPDGVALVKPDGSVVEFLSYEGSFVAASGPAAGLTSVDIGVLESGTTPLGYSLQRTGAGRIAADFGWAAEGPSTFGAPNAGQVFGDVPPAPACGDPATKIHEVQGSGTASPLVGTEVSIEGVVVGDYQDTSTELKGFYLQEEDADADAAPQTSEGVFVFDNGFGVDVAPGDVVRVKGRVGEFGGLTELSSVSAVEVCASSASVTPAGVSLPVGALTDFEAFEGMLVSFSQKLFVTENYNLGRYGSLSLSVGDRLYTPTNVVAPGSQAAALSDLNSRSRIELDDANNDQDFSPIRYLGDQGTRRIGESVTGLSGVLDDRFGLYRLQPVGPIAFDDENPRPAAPPEVGGRLKVGSFNVLNYFTTLDTGSPICGPSFNQDCRGANTPEEFARQRTKILSALSALNADVVGLLELENNASASLQDLVDGLNAQLGAGSYAFVDTGTIGTDAIKVGIIYKPGKVAPVGGYALLDSSVDPTFVDTKNRPVLAQTFREASTGEVFTLAVNHLKSKGSNCLDLGDPDTGDGQGNCSVTRTRAAAAEAAWLATDPTASGDEDFLLIGDFNAYLMEDPVSTLVDAGFSSLLADFIGPHARSYTFDGQGGALDHGFASFDLRAQVSGVAEWHINADEPSVLDYNLEYKTSDPYTPDAFRASDHDPLLIGLRLGPVCHGAPATVYVTPAGKVVGGLLDGRPYRGVLTGGDAGDVIVGTSGNDVIFAGKGDDVVCGLAGNDVLSGGRGDDQLFGGAGNDTLLAGPGDDQLDGGEGHDLCDGGFGNDTAEASCELRAFMP